VTGSGFVPSSVVRWNGSDRTTTYVSGSELRAVIGAGDVASTGSASVTVFTPSPGGGLSAGLTFMVNPPAGPSASPTVEATSVGVSAAAPSSIHVAALPSGVAAGKLLVACIAGDGAITAFTWPAGWTEISDSDQANVVLSCGYRIANGTEGASFSVTSTGNDRSRYFAHSITQHDPSTPPAVATVVGSGTAPNPPPLTPSWGAQETLWLAVVGLANSHLLTSGPASYTACQQSPTNNTGDPSIGVCRRSLTTATEDPGPFAQPNGGSWAAQTIAVRPASSGGNPVPAATALAPSSTPAGGVAFTLTVTGSNFVPNSVVRWNGGDRPTTFVDGATLQASIGQSDISTPGDASVTVFTPGPGGGVSEALTFTITNASQNPLPVASALAPSSGLAGGIGFTLTVTGNDFVPSSVVRWNGGAKTTTFVSATELRASIDPADIATAGTVPVTVFSPAPGGGTSAALTFSITNPTPVADALSPSSAPAGGAAFTLTVTGSSFVSSSVVRWNGEDRATTFVSSTQLQASIGTADIAVAGSASVVVFTPGPGGGLSAALTFAITPQSPSSTSLTVAESHADAAKRHRGGEPHRGVHRGRRPHHRIYVARGLDGKTRYRPGQRCVVLRLSSRRWE
jgi:hypothetical protein